MSKEMTKYTRVVNQLAKMFGYANEYFFNNELPVPTITVQSSACSYAHITTSTVWKSEIGESYELNISADYLNRPIENVTASLLHEMSHLYNIIHGIKDCSGYYHNKRFKKTAEEIAHLKIEQDVKYGWTVTSPTESTLEFIIFYGLEDFKINRGATLTTIEGGGSASGSGKALPKAMKPKGSNSIKWVCGCGNIIRSTKPVRAMCCDCDTMFAPAI